MPSDLFTKIFIQLNQTYHCIFVLYSLLESMEIPPIVTQEQAVVKILPPTQSKLKLNTFGHLRLENKLGELSRLRLYFSLASHIQIFLIIYKYMLKSTTKYLCFVLVLLFHFVSCYESAFVSYLYADDEFFAN